MKRVRKVRLLASLLDYLRDQMPKVTGADKKKQKLLGDMDGVRNIVCKKYDLSPGDFPEIPNFVEVAKAMDFNKFPALKGKRLRGGKLLTELDVGVNSKIPALLELLPTTAGYATANSSSSHFSPNPRSSSTAETTSSTAASEPPIRRKSSNQSGTSSKTPSNSDHEEVSAT